MSGHVLLEELLSHVPDFFGQIRAEGATGQDEGRAAQGPHERGPRDIQAKPPHT